MGSPKARYAGFFFFGIVVGVLSALSGMGGGFLIVPFLLALGYTNLTAPPTSLTAVLILASAALIGDAARGHVDYITGCSLAAGCVVGAQIGSRLIRKVPTHTFQKIFSVVLFLLAAYLVLTTVLPLLETVAHKQTEDPPHLSSFLISHVLVGIGIGILASFVGLGGGFVIVPYLLYRGFDPELATGTSFLAVIGNSLSSIYVHVKKKAEVDFIGAVCIGVGGIGGTQAGEAILPYIPGLEFKRGFGVLLAALAVYVFLRKPKPRSTAPSP